ncbi:hypothetical protein LEP1GSC021_3666 [Leptospira noguchii str. 1993005606]|nr:hypothetical protein LEP1GSC021_3666 [Leptospira noguchii str. 1993005606]
MAINKIALIDLFYKTEANIEFIFQQLYFVNVMFSLDSISN